MEVELVRLWELVQVQAEEVQRQQWPLQLA